MQQEKTQNSNLSYSYFEEPNPGILKFFKRKEHGKKVLDVGCGFGALGEQLKQKKNYVVGIDISNYAIGVAKSRIQEAHVCDITQLDNADFLQHEQFDVIIFADILDHLYDPESILKNFKNYLKPDGVIIVSLPNVAAWLIRLKLLIGKFDYQDSGILDKTHIRFFTKKTATKLLEGAGYKIEKINTTPFLIRALLPFVRKWFLRTDEKITNPRAVIDSSYYKFYIKWIYPIESLFTKINSKLFAFQFVFYARKK